MQTLNLIQGSAEWHAHRSASRNASDAPAVMGCSPYVTRTALLQQRHTGITPEVTADQQRRFDDGHAIEAAQLPGAETVIGETLYPVTGFAIVDGLKLSASFDGLTLGEDTAYECKTLNDTLRAALPNAGPDDNDAANLPVQYRIQMEQQLAVCAGERVLFVAANRDGSDVRRCWYTPDPALRADLLAAWRQFDADAAAYVMPEVAAAEPVGVKKISLPALVVDVKGEVVDSNLAVWKDHAVQYITAINTELVTDQHFADAAEDVKWCETGAARLKEVKAACIARMESVDVLFAAIDEIVATMDTKRLALSRLVESRKEARKKEIVDAGAKALSTHLAALEQRLRDSLTEGVVVKRDIMPATTADFWGCIKGKRNFALMESAVNDEVAKLKVQANMACELREKNLTALRDQAKDHRQLFADWAELIGKDPELVVLTIGQRIQAEKDRLAAEQKRLTDEAEARARQQQEQQAPATAPVAPPAAAGAPATDLFATNSPAAATPAASTVVPMTQRAAAPDTGVRIKLGDINARLAPLQLTADGLATLGFRPVTTEGAAKLFREADFPLICDAIVKLAQRARQPLAA